MGVPIDQMPLELQGELLLRAYLAYANEIPLPIGPDNVVDVVPKDVSSTSTPQATRDISPALGAILLSAQSRCLSSFRCSIAQTPRALPSAVALSGSSQLPVRHGMAPESFIRAYQLQFPLRRLSLSFGVSTKAPGFRHPMTGILPCANGTLAMAYDTEDVDKVIRNASPIFGNDTSPLFQMGVVVWPKLRQGTQRNLMVSLSAGARTNGFWQSHLASMLGYGLPAGVLQCAGKSPTQPKNSGSDKSGGQQQARRQGTKRPRTSEEDEEPESNSQRGSNNGSNDKEKTVDNEEYCCPYYLKDPIRHAACWKQKWRGNDLRKLKEHLEKKHFRWVCNSCNQAFVDRPSMDRHIHMVDGLRDYVDGFDHDQKDKLRDRSRFWDKNGKEYYNTICEIIFPGDPPLPAHRHFTWEEVQDIRGQDHEFREEMLDWFREAQRCGWIHPDGVASLTDIIKGRSPSILVDDALSSTSRPSPIVTSPHDGTVADHDWGWQRNSVFDGEMDSNIDDSDMYGSPPASATTLQPQQGSGSGPGTWSQRPEFLSNSLPLPQSNEHREAPLKGSMDETAPSSSVPCQSSLCRNSQNHDQGEYSPSSSPQLGMEYDNSGLNQMDTDFTDLLNKPDFEGTPRSNVDGADNYTPTNGARS